MFFSFRGLVKIPLLAFFSFLSLGVVILFKWQETERDAVSSHDAQVANSYANSIEKVIGHALSSTSALAVMVQQGGGAVPGFSGLAKFMLPMYKGAFAFSLAPKGVIRQIVPLVPNALLKNHDLFEGQDRDSIFKNVRDGDLEFQGPFKLVQGPQGAIGMLPVYLSGARGNRYFWGYTVVTLKLPDAIDDANLKSLPAQGYAYQLSGMNVETGLKEIIQASTEPLSELVEHANVEIQNVHWELKISRIKSWPGANYLLLELFFVLLGAVLAAWFGFLVLKLSQQRQQLQALAMYDPLTGLPNRRLLDISLDRRLRGLGADKTKLFVCYLDLDGFKAVNDSLGHSAGDLLLKETATRLRSCLRVDDILARIGGDEFSIVLVSAKSIEEASAVLERIVRVIGEPYKLLGELVYVSVSIGAVSCNSGEGAADYLLSIADQTMYLAKKAGKNRFLYAGDV